MNVIMAKNIFGENLILVEDKACKELGYTEYVNTQLNGRSYVDIYKKP